MGTSYLTGILRSAGGYLRGHSFEVSCVAVVLLTLCMVAFCSGGESGPDRSRSGGAVREDVRNPQSGKDVPEESRVYDSFDEQF